MIRVAIATTRGPSLVQRITPEDPDVRSVVCLDGKAMPLPISTSYDHFVRVPTGVIERRFGHCAYRMDVEQPIDDGASWQLGVYLAHALAAAGRLAGRGQQEEALLWCTGEVDAELTVRPVEHVAEKLERSLPLFREALAAGRRLIILVASGAGPDPAVWAAAQGLDPALTEAATVESIADAAGLLGIEPLDRASGSSDDDAPRRRPSVLTVSVLALAVAILVGGWLVGRGLGTVDQQIGDRIAPVPAVSAVPTPAPKARQVLSPGLSIASRSAPLQLSIAELRMSDGAACPSEFAPDKLAEHPLGLDGQGRFSQSTLPGLCGLRFRVASQAGPVHLWAFAQMVPERLFLLADRGGLIKSDGETTEAAQWEVPIPAERDQPLDYVLVGMAGTGPLSQAVARLPRQIDWSLERPFSEEFKSAGEDLVRQGVTLVVAHHHVAP